MNYNHFRLHVIVRVLLIAANLYAFFFILIHTHLYATTVLLGLLPIWQIWSLLSYVQRTNRQISRFIETIQAADFSERLPNTHGNNGFGELSRSLNHAIQLLAANRAEIEQQRRFFRSVIQQVGVGLITLKPDGSVEFMNRSAGYLLGLSKFSHIRQLDALAPDLAAVLMRIESGKRRWIEVKNGGHRMRLALFVQTIHLPHPGGYKLLTLQNLQPELEETESEAWKNLSRVLSHEIMNSLTPISSLAATALDLMPTGPDLSFEAHADLYAAIQTIHRRSQGLMKFVYSYRRFANIPKPCREPFGIARLFERMDALMQGTLAERCIVLERRITPANLHACIDPAMIEQVLLNVLTNALDAVLERPNPRIQLAAVADHHGRTEVRITDNGKGMEENVQAKMFIPFFTTKANGSGVGLSISRQIMRLHDGSISIESAAEQGTIVTLRF